LGDKKRVITVGTGPLHICDVLSVAAGEARVVLDESPAYRQFLDRSVELVDRLISQGQTIYGVTTGFGDSCEKPIPPELSARMAANLVRFHGCGTGRMLSDEECAAVIFVRLVSLAQGRSGVRPALLERLCDLLNHQSLPQIPSEGSVGASGDLTPLSYIAAVVMGEREVSYKGKVVPAAEALGELRLKPIELRPKESLALMNGTSVMTGLACLAYQRARQLSRWASALTAMSSDVLRGNRGHFDDRIFLAKPHPGQRASARWIAADIEYRGGSTQHDGRIQDRYSVRCAPHVIGVLLDSLSFIDGMLDIEINSSNDNPLFDVATDEVLHCGNFYGGHVCMAMDMLKTAVANVADLIDRQMALICNPATNNGLPADLVARNSADHATHHGFKAMQITASALTAEALKLTMPASVFSRSTESHNQDKVSMGSIASRDALRVLELTETVLAVVQLALCQAVDLRNREGCHVRSKALHQAIRKYIAVNDADRRQDGDIDRVLEMYRKRGLPIGEMDGV